MDKMSEQQHPRSLSSARMWVFPGRPPISVGVLAMVAAISAIPSTALAHAGQRGFVMLLPTKLFIAGGGGVVLLTFLLIVLLPAGVFRTRPGALEAHTAGASLWLSRLSLLILSGLILCGYVGSRDPLANPLPLVTWVVWWVGFTFFTALAGNAWAKLHPWHALHDLLSRLPGVRALTANPVLAYPARLGYWPAVLGFFVFAWFELIYPAPQDPALLAGAILIYLLISVFALILFGKTAWLNYGDPFCFFFRMVGWLAPVYRAPTPDGARRCWKLGWPGQGLLGREPLPVSGVAFVLLALSSVSFDGLSRSFWWLGLIGENPLEYPGRTVLMLPNTVGFLAVFGAFLTLYAATVYSGASLSGERDEKLQGRFVLSIIPIAFGYHFAHYLPEFLVDIQYALIAVSDPLTNGLNLFGTAGLHVHASFLTHHHSVEMIWYAQVAGIVSAHILAVVIGHALVVQQGQSRKTVLLGQVPATVLMVAYTVFGLWLLSSPTAG